MPDQIDPNDQDIIVKTFNKTIEDADKERDDFLKILLTIYTPVTSGLVFLSTTIRFDGGLGYEKISFLFILGSSVLIVLSSLIEKLAYVLIAINIGETYTAHVRETGKHLNKPLYGKPWQSFLVECQPYLKLVLILINVISIFWFTLLRVY